MKSLRLFFLLSFLSICGLVQAQNPVTFYVTPPTNGCDGVWALDNNTMWCGQAWSITDTTPSGSPCCPYNGWVISNDTVYIPLCSLPCSFVFIDVMSAQVCGTAQTPLSLNSNPVADENKNYGFPSLLKAGGFYTVHFKSCTAEQLEVYDIRGAKMNAAITATENDYLQIHCENFSPGIYFVRDTKGIFPAMRFAIVR